MHARRPLVDPQTDSDIADGRIGFKNPNGGGHERMKIFVFPGERLQSAEEFRLVLRKRTASQEVEPIQPIAAPERIETCIADRPFGMMRE
jgi:hypothetical protein